MNVEIKVENGYMKGAILELTPSELLLIQAAMEEFYCNHSRKWDDRAAVYRMYDQIYKAERGWANETD